MIINIFLAFILSSFTANAEPIDEWPLRSIELESTFYINNFFILFQAGATLTYQDGASITKFGPNFDSAKPFCDISTPPFSPISVTDQTFKVISILGNTRESRILETPHFETEIAFQNIQEPSAILTMNCFSLSKGTFDEMSLGEFFKALGLQFAAEDLSLKRTGPTNPALISPFYVLNFEDLAFRNILEATQDIVLEKIEDGHYISTIQGGKVGDLEAEAGLSISKNFCSIYLLDDSQNPISDDVITIKKGFKTKFSSAFSSYGKSDKAMIFYYGYEYGGKLSGYKEPGDLYLTCTNPNPNTHPYYNHLINTLGGVFSVLLDLN